MAELSVAKQAITELFQLYADDVYRFARYSLHNDGDAKDVVQEVFLRAYRGWTDFRKDSNGKTWLLHIARNYVYDVLRKKRVEGNYRALHPPDVDTVSRPLQTAVELEDMVQRLPPTYREVFVLRTIEDMSVEETATTLGWSAAKVRTTYHRAIKQLQDMLNEGIPLNKSMTSFETKGDSHAKKSH